MMVLIASAGLNNSASAASLAVVQDPSLLLHNCTIAVLPS